MCKRDIYNLMHNPIFMYIDMFTWIKYTLYVSCSVKTKITSRQHIEYIIFSLHSMRLGKFRCQNYVTSFVKYTTKTAVSNQNTDTSNGGLEDPTYN